jgi:hypothetical protein
MFAVPSIWKMPSQSAITIDIKLGFCGTSLMAAQGLSHRLLTEEPLLTLKNGKPIGNRRRHQTGVSLNFLDGSTRPFP